MPTWKSKSLVTLRGAVAADLSVMGGGVRLLSSTFLPYLPSIPYKNQDGPTCGLYALRNVMRYHYNSLVRQGLPLAECLRRAPQLPARKREQDQRCGSNDAHAEDAAGLWTPEGLSLREVAKASRLTGVGELLDGRYIAQIAKKLGYEAQSGTYLDRSYMTTIKLALQRNVPPIVVFDVSRGGPAMAQGAHGHWIVVVGWESLGNVAAGRWEVVYVMHWGSFYAFLLEDLMKSSQQLQSFPSGTLQKSYNNKGAQVEGKWEWQADPISTQSLGKAPQTSAYVRRCFFGNRPKGLRQADITSGLRGVIVTVEPPAAPVNTFAPEVQRVVKEYNGGLSRIFRRPSRESLEAVKVLDQMVCNGAGLTELLDAVLHYSTSHDSRNPAGAPGPKLKPSSTLCGQLKKAVELWCSRA
jgi:hypothetical protein